MKIIIYLLILVPFNLIGQDIPKFEWIATRDYDEFFPFSNGVALVAKDKKYGLVNIKGNEVAPIEYEKIDLWFLWGLTGDDLIRVKKNNLYGFININTGEEIISTQYNFATTFSEGLAGVGSDDKMGYINRKGNIVIPFIYSSISNFLGGRADVTLNGQEFSIDRTGKKIFKHNCHCELLFSEGLAPYKGGYIDENGKIVIPQIYQFTDDFQNGFARVKKSEKWGLINKIGNEVIPFNYDGVEDAQNGIVRVKKNGLWGLIDKNGREIVPCIFDFNFIYSFEDKTTFYEKDKKFGFINSKGEILTKHVYLGAWHFDEGLSRVRGVNGMFGFLDESGKIKIPLQYGNATGFSQGLSAVKKGRYWGFINHSGNTIIPFVFEEALGFKEGFAWVKKDGILGVIKHPLVK